MTDILETIKEMVVGGKFNGIEEQVQRAVDSGTDLNRIIFEKLKIRDNPQKCIRI